MFERTLPFIDLFDLLFLIVTPSVFDTQRLRASLLYNLRPIARIDIAVFGEVSNLFNFIKGGAACGCSARDRQLTRENERVWCDYALRDIIKMGVV